MGSDGGGLAAPEWLWMGERRGRRSRVWVAVGVVVQPLRETDGEESEIDEPGSDSVSAWWLGR